MRARMAVVPLVALVLAAGACSNSSSGSSGGKASNSNKTVDQPGVTKDTIRVGGVVAKTNPLNGPYAAAFDGTQAYLNMVNASGGIYGRKLQLVAKRDDQTGMNQQEVQGLLQQDNVFAALPIATIASFSGAKVLAAQNVPTFGWEINDEWTGPKNLFGLDGYACITCPTPQVPWVAHEAGKKHVALLAYNVANSKDCADTAKKSFEKYPTANVDFVTTSLSFGASDFSVEVSQMKDKHVDFIEPCLDQNAVLSLAKEMKKQGLEATLYLPNAYDQKFVNANKEFLDGSIVLTQFAPFETSPKPAGLVAFDKWMAKGNFVKNESAMVGWLDADLFVTGLRAAGPEFTRQKVIDALNSPKLRNYTAGGLLPGSETISHTKSFIQTCASYLKIVNDKFVPTFVPKGKAFVCIPHNPPNPPKLPQPTYR
jgi:branched-chain amino acid transport system substrate-binding protein